MKWGTKSISDVRYGYKPVIRVYSGSKLVWELNKDLSGEWNGYMWVDLGLPSGTLWAFHNVGAEQPYHDGDYYAWGETSIKAGYYEDNSVTTGLQMSDYSGNDDYDVASSKWGGGWRTPTLDEIEELRYYCTFEVVNSMSMFPSQTSDKIGLKITGRNGKEIFIPYNGHILNETTFFNNDALFLWSSTPTNDDTSELAWGSICPHDGLNYIVGYIARRYYGFGVRPVLDRASMNPQPITYTRLAYIECNGQQYINTNYVVQEDDIIDMYYISTATTSADKALFGVAESGNGIWATIYSNTSYLRFGSTASATISNARMRYKITLKKGSAVIDDSTASPAFASMPNIPLYIFASNNNNNKVNMYGYCRSMGFKISKPNGDIVMNLKPCKRDSDGKIGMLDLVSGQFFTNQGDGDDFLAGSEMQMGDGYEAIDYVTFNADKLFDAGIIDNTYTIEVLFERTETAAARYLYGVITSPHTASVTAYLTSSGSWRFGSSYRGFTANTLKMYKVEISNGTFVGDFTSSTFTKSTFTTPDTLVVGGSRAASGSTSKSYRGLLYYFRIKKSGKYIADWYPCRRKSDGVEGFWDCVTQSFVEPM